MRSKSFLSGDCYNYPLILKKLLNTPLIYSPDQEIVYKDRFRYTYMEKAAEKGRLPRYGVPDRFEFVDQIPKTSVGKLDKKSIRKRYA